MAVFKRERCMTCKYIHNEPRPGKVNQDCPRCGTRMYYLPHWYLSYQIEGRKYIEVGGPQKRMAEDALAKRKVDIREGRFFDKRPSVPWSKQAESFKKWVLTNVSKNTARMYENSLKALSPHFGRHDLVQITAKAVEEYKERRKGTGVSNATINRDLATIKRMFSLAVKWGDLETDKVRHVRLLPEKERLRFLKSDEVKKLLALCQKSSPHLYLAILIALETGLRKDGSLTLRWTEIDFSRKSISKTAKGGKEVYIPLTRRLEEALLEYRASQKILSQYVLASNSDKSKPFGSLKKSFGEACKKAKIQDFRWHDLRHTFASHFLMQTKDIKALQEILGHADLKTTMKYAHLLDEHKQEAMRKFSEGWEPKSSVSL